MNMGKVMSWSTDESGEEGREGESESSSFAPFPFAHFCSSLTLKELNFRNVKQSKITFSNQN